MLLQNLNIIGEVESKHIRIINDKIEKFIPEKELTKLNHEEISIIFDKAIAFPGLINSHDHLEFNLFPKFGNSVYKNYREWGSDIHRQNENIISNITKIPKQLRARWGVYKNLLNGVTTVVHHGGYINIENGPINIFQNCHTLHSVREKYWKLKLNNPFKKDWPFVIHVGEGTDISAFEEISELIRWNLFKKRLIAIHGVAMNMQQAKAFEALIWCPDSNFFLLNATARVNELKTQTTILFGTDSTVSANWNMWEQIRLARNLNMLTDEELFDSMTISPSAVWELSNRGALRNGKKADIVISRMKNKNNLMSSFFQLNPEDILLILTNGEIALFDETIKNQLATKVILNDFSKIFINNVGKYVKGNLAELINAIKKITQEVKLPIEIE